MIERPTAARTGPGDGCDDRRRRASEDETGQHGDQYLPLPRLRVREQRAHHAVAQPRHCANKSDAGQHDQRRGRKLPAVAAAGVVAGEPGEAGDVDAHARGDGPMLDSPIPVADRARSCPAAR